MIINREKEIQELNKRYESGKPEFIAIYGRRRVGKTFLINEVFNNKFTFKHSGLSPISEDKKKNNNSKMKMQLKHFYHSLLSQGVEKTKCPADWLEAFLMLSQFLSKNDTGTRQVIFFDEIQWMDTPRSDFIAGLESFWNGWGCSRKNVMLIVCGSSTSWITDKLINNHGGLYGRLTDWFYLAPFNLEECEKYLQTMEVKMSRYDIAQIYMTFGGIPFYLDFINREKSYAKNIDNLFFLKEAKLKDEYDRLFSSIFAKSEQIKLIVEALYSKRKGLSRREIVSKTKLSDNSDLSTMLKALENGEFIKKYVSFGESKKNPLYKLIDPFCLFYLHFVKGAGNKDENYFENQQDSQAVTVWKGLAFENLCFNHIRQIKNALGISGVSTNETMWSRRGDDNIEGAQIDMIIERKDNILNMCEIKFYSDEYVANKKCHFDIMERESLLRNMISKKTSIHPVLITTFGLKKGEYWNDFIKTITLDDLFQ